MAADTVIVSADNIVPVGVDFTDHDIIRSCCRLPRRQLDERANGTADHHCAAHRRGNQGRHARQSGHWDPDGGGKLHPEGLHVFFQSENGLIGTGAPPQEGMAHPMLTDAGGPPVTALPGACTFDSAISSALIRGGHLDLTVLGFLQVDQRGYLANWMIPNKMVPGMGGAMDLVSGAKRLIVAMQHSAKGAAKIVKKCTLPITAMRPVDLVVTQLAVIGFPEGRATPARRPVRSFRGPVAGATEASLDLDQGPGNAF